MKRQEYIKPLIEAYMLQTESFIALSSSFNSEGSTRIGYGGEANEENEPEGGYMPY
ncbi:MAG: hypothetical protein ACI4V5_06585 [Prevotella sp.]